MGSKLTFFIVICAQLFLKLQITDSYPIFGYVFGNGDATEAEMAEHTDFVEVDTVGQSTIDSGGNKVTVEVTEKVEPMVKPPQPVASAGKEIVNANVVENKGKGTKVEPSGNKGFGANSVGFAARLLGRGINGVRQLVDGSTNLATSAINGAEVVTNSTVDGMQEIIDHGMKRAVNRLSRGAQILDLYRKSLSAGSKKDPDQAHSLVLTTSSKTPTQFLTNLYNEYSGGLSGPSIMPEITGVDLSNWSFW